MKRFNESEMEMRRFAGTKGHVDVWDAVRGPIVAGVREVAPNSDVPPRPHRHQEAQLLYVISGTPAITNGQETFGLRPGDFVLLEPNEEHYVVTKDRPAKLFEVLYGV
ncbi:MAG: cupin domain-containing protein [Candidatus Thorarchaeota archaeon]